MKKNNFLLLEVILTLSLCAAILPKIMHSHLFLSKVTSNNQLETNFQLEIEETFLKVKKQLQLPSTFKTLKLNQTLSFSEDSFLVDALPIEEKKNAFLVQVNIHTNNKHNYYRKLFIYNEQ